MKRDPKEIASVIGELARDAAGMISQLKNDQAKRMAITTMELSEGIFRSLVIDLGNLPKLPPTADEHCNAG